MNGFSHFYARYGLALALSKKNVSTPEDLPASDWSNLLGDSLLHFRVKPKEDWNGKSEITFEYACLKDGKPDKGIFLAPTVITSDQSAKRLFAKIEEIQGKLGQEKPPPKESAQQSFAPTAGEYNNGNASKRSASIPFVEAVCCAITTLTSDKPAYTRIEMVKGKPTLHNTTILPDLPLHELRQFINVFSSVSKFKTDKLMDGKVNQKDGKPNRPAISRGNFPNAPKSSSLRAFGLLGAIGEWAKESDETGLGETVLQSLETCPIYLVSPEDTRITNFNHYLVKLARENRLSSIIDSLYYVSPFSLTRKSDFKELDREREKIAFFAARFLQLFDEMSFREFLAVRAEYPHPLEILLKTFFMEKKQIDPHIVRSAKALGSWLNYVAYKVAAAESKENIREMKAKVLVELESSAFSAKSGPALIAQAVTRAGRLSQTEAPAEAELFMEKTMSGELELQDAQQMLMAFSRLRNKFEPKNTSSDEDGFSDEHTEEAEDFSDAQDND